jgi:hypothetical protein
MKPGCEAANYDNVLARVGRNRIGDLADHAGGETSLIVFAFCAGDQVLEKISGLGL